MTAMRPDVSLAVSAWVSWSQRHAKAVVAAIAILTAVLAFYVATHLSVDTNTEHLLSPQLPWRRAVAQLDREFPQLSNTLVVVIDGATPELAEAAEEQLLRELALRKDLFVELFALDAEPFFRRNGLLFLDRAELDSVQSSLIRAQPFLGTLDSHPTLASLFTLLTRALERPETGFDLAPALGQLGHAVGQVNEGHFDRLSWALLTGNTTGAASPRAKRFIEIAPRFEFDRLLPAGRGIDFIRATAQRLKLTPDRGITIRLTGSVAMEHEELLTAVTGAGISLGAAFVMIAVLLYLALRSARLVITAVLTLITGLVFTAAFAAFAVGHLNMISVAFGVLYVGLGIDYALYISMEYRELLSRGEPPHSAIPSAARRMGGFMVICAATTSIAFLAFVPTSFTAIAELGAISAFGMLMSFLMSITLLPALVRLMPPDPGRVTLRSDRFGALSTWPYRHGRALWIGAGIAACGALALLPRVHFDADPIDLRDPKSESVATYRELVQNPEIPTLTLSALANNASDAQRLAERLGALPGVKQVLTLQSFIPEDQPAKLAIVEDLALALGPDFTDKPAPARAVADPADEPSLRELIARLRATPAAATDAQSRAARGLLKQLERFQTSLDSQRGAARAELLGRLRETLLGTLPIVLRDVRDTLKASMVSIDDLPAALISRWRSPQGHYRVEAAPREILIGIPPMQRFLNEVRSVAPQAVGPPLVILESANAVVSAFRRAFAFSAIAIVLLLIVLLRRPADVLLAIVPLAFAGLFTAAGMALLGLSFNFANVIALPLILGVGIDYGVYIVQRGRESEAAAANLLRSGAARAVFFGALITIASFGNLVWSRHPGTVSLGLVLTLGLAITLTSALVFLPSLLLARQRRLAVRAARVASDRRPER